MSEPDSFVVSSSDGTPLRVWVEGDGPPILLVHGSLRDHAIFEPFVAALRTHMTTYALDRRGFGASGDTGAYAIAQEFRDVATVVETIAARQGPVALFGHSYGAGCAMGAAALTDRVSHLVLYEPGLGIAYPPGWIETRERELEAGDREMVIRKVLSDILEMTREEIAERQATPRWREYLAAATTVLRECRTENGWIYEPTTFAGISIPTLFLTGTETAPELMRATLRALAAIPAARVRALAGHGHLACITDPGLIASIVLQFVSARS